MTGIVFIRDLAVVLVTAGIAAWVCQRLGLSAVVGYLLAGAIIGPFTPPFALVADLDRVQTLAQIGLVFLVFSIGLNLSLSRLKRLGLSTVVATAISAILVLNGCRIFGWTMGWTTTASLFLAGMLMVSSSAIISKVLEELNLTHERPGQLALAVTVLEDLVAITMLTLLSSLAQYKGAASPSLLPTLGTLGAFIVFLAVMALLIIPKLLARLSREATLEIRTLVVAGLLLSLASLAVSVGYSLALGAFIFGVVVGSTRYKSDIERGFDGLRQLFGAVFFVAVGMMVDFRLLLEAWPYLIAVTLLALLLRPLACTLGFIAVGNSSRESIQAGLSLVPLGEFTFVIAQVGVESGLLPKSVYPVAAGAALLTALAAPVLTRRAEPLSERLARLEPPVLRQGIEFYHDWLTRLRTRQTAGLLWRLTRKRLLQLAVYVLFVSALLLFVRPIYERARAALETDGPFPQALPFVFWSVFGIVLLAPLIAIWRNIVALSMMVADAATTGARRQRILRPLLERALTTVALAVLAAWLLVLLPGGWSLLGAAGGVLLLLAAVAVVFWRRFIKWQSRVEIELLEQLQRASQATAASAWSDYLPRQTADWNLEIDEVTLPGDTPHAGKTLGQLALRSEFGCSVVGIDRQGYSLVNPGADTVLYPHDKLLLLGGPAELARAGRKLLNAEAAPEPQTGFDELTMETLAVPPACPLAGRPLAELDLIRRYGIQIGGIRRAGRRILSPTGRDSFQPGDELLVLGLHTQIKEFARHLAPLAPDRKSAAPETR
ncbi:MAG TPA: cation:proton antiporter [Candidatus Paceibacterota bacterium]|jgi:CPA2 family monovalent cation:H+ antiporter-2|nr:cation:proton antiporter [Candidatus Paceibacterota bacterium]